VVAVLGTIAYTRVGPGTSYVYLSGALLVIGIGVGATVVPSMAAAFQALSRAETPRATSAINAIQRIAGAIGTALFAIIVQQAITSNLSGRSGSGPQIAALGGHAQAHTAGAIADAFGLTFWIAAGLIATALVPAMLLPRRGRHRAAEVKAAEQVNAS
jgi:hypothetical protein